MGKVPVQKGPLAVPGSYRTATHPEKVKEAQEHMAMKRKNINLTIVTPKKSK